MRAITAIPLTAGLCLLATTAAPAAGLITDVVQTGGRADRPPAQWTGQSYVNPAPFFGGQPITVGVFEEDALAMTDRVHNYNGALTTLPLPPYLVGYEYIQIANDNRSSADFRLDITVSGPATVFLLLDNRLGDGNNANPPTLSDTLMPWVAAQGFIPVLTGHNRAASVDFPDELGVDEGSSGDGSGRGTGPGMDINQFSSVFMRDVPAGTFTLLEQNGGGINMYGVVVTPPQAVPEPGAAALAGVAALVLGLMRRRR